MTYTIENAKQYKKSLRRYLKSGNFDLKKLDKVLSIISSGKNLEPKYRDHSLAGDFIGVRECHIEPDLLLLYKIYKETEILFLIDIGSHSELFG